MIGSVAECAAAIQHGQVIVIPTDTVYGLACDPASAEAVERIYAIKQRPAELELTLLGADAADFEGMVVMTAGVRAVAERYWPGALSIVLSVGPRRIALPRRGSTLSVRVPAHDTLAELLRLTGPLATTSANRHGEPAAETAPEAESELGREVALVLDGGRGGGRPSTIIDCAADPPRCLREGPIPWEEIRSQLMPAPGGEPSRGDTS